MKRIFTLLLTMALALGLVACGSTSGSGSSTGSTKTYDLTLDMAAWRYDATNDVYYQIGLVYCTTPQAAAYESLGLYVPGAYMTGTANGDGTYTCTVNASGTVGSYTAATAPYVLPVNTPGYAAQAAPTSYSYSDVASYIQAGFIYVYAGCRGRSNGTNDDGSSYAGGSPWGVTDLKAAIRYIRYNAAQLPGNAADTFTFGMSGGGAQSAIVGASGDSPLYTAYLNAIGAAMTDAAGNTLSDAVVGSMCWCPITSLDEADEAYEWMMGQYATTGTRADGTFTAALSDDLAAAFAEYINAIGLKDASGNTLTLEATDGSIYAAGTYYDYLVGVIEQSLDNFLSDTAFPYTPASTNGGMGGRPSGGPASKSAATAMSSAATATYQTAQEYIDALNGDDPWISYDAKTNTATITSIAAFVTHCKQATKDVGAFDDLNRSQAENDVFGTADSDALHFDAVMAKLLADNKDKYAACSDFDASYADAYAGDLKSVDALGTDSATRQQMYNPMYYVCAGYDGYGSATVAKYWRINTGLFQGDTALTTETNLALALQANAAVSSVDFTTVWGLGHTTAERTGDSTSNFISWVNSCLS